MSPIRRSILFTLILFMVVLVGIQPALAAMIDEDAPIQPRSTVKMSLDQAALAEAPPAVRAVSVGKKSTWYWWVLGVLAIGGIAAAAGGGGGGGGGGSTAPTGTDTTSVTATW